MAEQVSCQESGGETTGQVVVLVAQDVSLHAALRAHVAVVQPGWRVDAYAGRQLAMQGIRKMPPDVALVGERLADGCGLEFARWVRQRLPAVPVVIWTRQPCAEKLLRVLMAGAMGYVVGNGEGVPLVEHLRKAMSGRFALCEETERLLPKLFAEAAHEHPRGLTRRETEVMKCLCQRLSDKEVANALNLSEHTVHCHLDRIFKKLGVHDRKSAIRLFAASGLGGG